MESRSYTDPLLAGQRPVEAIGAGQTAVPYTEVADGGNGTILITADDHGLKKRQTIYIATGHYAGVHPVMKVVDKDTIQVQHEFFEDDGGGDLEKLSSLDGIGFTVDAVPLTIAEFDPENKLQDKQVIIDRVYAVGDYVPIPFRKIRISAGDITCYRGPIKAELAYDRDNRLPTAHPVLESATVEDAADNEIVLTYTSDFNLQEKEVNPEKFVLTGVDSEPTIDTVVVDGAAKTVTLTLSASVVEADQPVLSYIPSGFKFSNDIQDVHGQKASGFTDLSIENNVVDA